MPSLEFDELLRSVPRGEIAPAYYFHGDQDLLKDDALRLLLDQSLEASTRDFNLDRRRAADLSADDFQTRALTPPMLAARRALVITEIEDLQARRTRAQELRTALLAYLGKPLPETLLIMVQSAGEKVDPELARRAASVDFKALEPGRVKKWMKHRAKELGLALDESAVQHLFDVVGDDLAQLVAELSKLKSAVGERTATGDDVADLVGVRRGETIHEFTDAVTGRRFVDAAGMVDHLLSAPGQSGVQLLISLGTALAAVALARARLDAGSRNPAYDLKQAFFAARPMGVRDYDERSGRWAKDAAGWTTPDLEAALAALLKADKRLKSTSNTGEAEIVVETILSLAAAEVA